jgi:FlaA1/EpsC-like NDP-sugar epimerase
MITFFLDQGVYHAAVMINFFLIATGIIGASRFGMRHFLRATTSRHADRLIIWGAGHTGLQLAQSLHISRQWTPVAFVDDDSALWGRTLQRLPCIAPEKLAAFADRKRVGTIILAMPTATQTQRRRVIDRLEQLGIAIKTVPHMREVLSGQQTQNDIREVPIADLLGRDPVPASDALLRRNITGKTVLVTGAGGSIGSELCRQILSLQPSRLILLERSEFSLYRVEHELRQRITMNYEHVDLPTLVPLLGSAGNSVLIDRLFASWKVDTVYHAAAYKHVPIVEENVAEGIANNTIATWVTAEAALKGGVETFILVSTDKAVRPTNVMGASKRMAEMVLQSLMQRQHGNIKTRYSMVRFGNVLGSSGSVVPLFREQIRQGGPVTVTHPDINRFFMTVEEAVQLVIQAGSMAEGGEVYVLDMGEPMKIRDLAQRMIQLSGHTLQDDDHPMGMISIQYTGLRPGEKLYEELLIGDNVRGTSHPRIMRGNESTPPWERLESWLVSLQTACAVGDCASIRSILNEAVEGYQPGTKIHDLAWQADGTNTRHESWANETAALRPNEEHEHNA